MRLGWLIAAVMLAFARMNIAYALMFAPAEGGVAGAAQTTPRAVGVEAPSLHLDSGIEHVELSSSGFGMPQAQEITTLGIQTRRQIKLKIGASILGNGASRLREFTFDEQVLGRVWIFSDDAYNTLWRYDSKGEARLDLTPETRNYITFQCGVGAILTITDATSFELSIGFEGSRAPIYVESTAKINTASIGSLESIFLRASRAQMIRRRPATGQTAGKGQRVLLGPTQREIGQFCRDFSRNPQVLAALETDMAVRSRNWRYVNRQTSCVSDDDCEDFFHGRQNGGVIPRCIVIHPNTERAYRSCQVRSTEGGTCTPKGRAALAFSYPCDQGLSCVEAAEGFWPMQRYVGSCSRS